MLLNTRAKWAAVLAGLFAVLTWSALPVLVKLALRDVPTSYFLMLRFLISAVFCLSMFRFSIARLRTVRAREWLLLTMTLAGNFVLQTLAIRSLPASYYILVFTASPLISIFMLGLRLNRRARTGVALAVAGTFGFAYTSDAVTSSMWPALLALVGGMLTWAFYSKLAKGIQTRLGDRELSSVTNVLSFAPMLLIWASNGAPTAPLNSIALVALLVLGVFVPLAYWAFLYCLRIMPTFGVTSQYLEPVFGVALAAMVLGETLSPVQAFSGVLILIGVAFVPS